MSTVLYLDCASGASGDMLLGALIDLGVPLDELRAVLQPMVPAGTDLRADRVQRAGIGALAFTVVEPGQPGDFGHAHQHDHGLDHGHVHDHDHDQGHLHGHDHGHDHGHTGAADAGHGAHTHHHRPLAEIFADIARCTLPAEVTNKALALYERIGRVEAAIHGVPLDQVHLHEVGAVDSVVDIVGAAYAFHWLGVDRVVSSPLNVGGGRVRTAHGLLPVPAPATLQLLEGTPVYSDGTPQELLTPTGALLVTGYASAFGPMPQMTIARTGYGAGGRELPDRPNVLRAVLGEEGVPGSGDRVVVVETNIDDMSPQILGAVMDRLFAAGALDVFFTPVQMKKNRPGTLVTAIAAPSAHQAVAAVLFRETTTIGVRFRDETRACLAREVRHVATSFGEVRVKVVHHDSLVKCMPEFDDCARLAAARGVPVREVHAAALRAAGDLAAGDPVFTTSPKESPHD